MAAGNDGEVLSDLGRGRLVPILADQIRAAARPGRSHVIALTGPWGSGKTWLLDRLRANLMPAVSDDGDIVVEFNPWLFTDEATLMRGFTTMLLGPSALKKSGRLLLANVISFVQIGADVPFVSGNLAPMSKALADKVSPIGSPTTMRAAISKALNLRGRRLFVVMDDLDRLGPTELLALFRLVRLLGDIPNLYYVLAYDQDTVLRLLDHTDIAAGDPTRSEQYLEKIIETRIPLPPLTSQQIERLTIDPVLSWARDLDKEFSEGEEALIRFRLAPLVLRCVSTPRAAERFLSTVRSLEPRMAGEIRIEHWVLAALIRTFYPRVWEAVVSERDLLTGIVRDIAPDRDATMRRRAEALHLRFTSMLGSSPMAPDILELLKLLFPAYAKLAAGRALSEWDIDGTAAKRGIGHPDFIERYLWPDLPPDHIAEGEIRRLIGLLPDSEAAASLQELFVAAPQPVLAAISRNTSQSPVARLTILSLLERLRDVDEVTGVPVRMAHAMLATHAATLLPWLSGADLSQVWNPTMDESPAERPLLRAVLTDQDLLRYLPEGDLKVWTEEVREALRTSLRDRLWNAPSPSLGAAETREDVIDLLRLDQDGARDTIARQLGARAWRGDDIASLYAISHEGRPQADAGIAMDSLARDLGASLFDSLLEWAANADTVDEPSMQLDEAADGRVEAVRAISREALRSHAATRGEATT